MGVYLGNLPVKFYSGNRKYLPNFESALPVTNGTLLLSVDNYVLVDINRTYLTATENSKNILFSDDGD